MKYVHDTYTHTKYVFSMLYVYVYPFFQGRHSGITVLETVPALFFVLHTYIHIHVFIYIYVHTQIYVYVYHLFSGEALWNHGFENSFRAALCITYIHIYPYIHIYGYTHTYICVYTFITFLGRSQLGVTVLKTAPVFSLRITELIIT